MYQPLDPPAWLRRRWHDAWRENDVIILGIFVDFIGRWLSQDLTWR